MISAPKEDSQLATLYKSNILDPLDKLVISPNRLVTLRTGVSITVAACLAFSENLWVPIEAWLIALWTAALVADKTDWDLARHTDQCSDEGEVLDAGADKVIVYTSLLFVLLNLPENVSTNTQNWLMTWVWI
jgi:phosphatidylglycerophosphate synthase